MVNMRQSIILFIILLLTIKIAADDFVNFRNLSAEEKIQKILEEYQYDMHYARRLDFARYSTILTENPDENIPVLYASLEKLPMLPLIDSYSNNAYPIIDNIIWSKFHMNCGLLSQEELYKLAAIYQQKVCKFIETYGVIDVVVVGTTLSIELITSKRKYGEAKGLRKMADDLFRKYTKLGYKDLRVDYTNLYN